MWWIVAVINVVAGIVCWVILSREWIKATNDNSFLSIKQIEILRVFHPIFPGAYHSFMDLKWTIIRHGVIGIVSAVLAWYINVGFIETIIPALNLLYAISTVNRYRKRNDELSCIWYEEKISGHDDHLNTKTARPLVEASKVTAVYAVIVYAILQIMLLYKWFSI